MQTGEVQRTDRDGIPVFWAPAPGAFRAGAMFRVGDGDERLPERGITHLVEHLTLFAAKAAVDDMNGFVSYDRCVLHAAGDRQEVLAWLERCAAALTQLPLERLDAERRILGIEEERAGGAGPQALLGRVLVQRFGARGPGVSAYPQIGLRWLGPNRVAAWARERFTRADVAVRVVGRIPGELIVPTARREAVDAVERLAARLPDQRAVGQELSLLPGVLRDSERLEALLPFGAGKRSGLLSVTSERLLCWFLAAGAEEVEELPRRDVRGARVRRRPLRRARLEIDCATPFWLEVSEPERAADVARLIAPA